VRLFSRHGARRVTIEELCREAGVSKMTFYTYFANKTALVKTIRDTWMEEGFRKYDEINALDLPFSEKIQLMGRWKAEFAARISVDFITELVSIDDVLCEVKSRFLKNIADAREQGEIRSDIDLEFLWLVIEKLGELVTEERWKETFQEFGQYQRQIRTLLFFGLLTRDEGGGGPVEQPGSRKPGDAPQDAASTDAKTPGDAASSRLEEKEKCG